MNIETEVMKQVSELNAHLGRIASALERLADKNEEAPSPPQGGPAIDIPLPKG